MLPYKILNKMLSYQQITGTPGEGRRRRRTEIAMKHQPVEVRGKHRERECSKRFQISVVG